MGKGIVRRIVIEYDEVKNRNVAMGRSSIDPVFKRIISWLHKDGEMTWKEIKCPQKSFYGMKGYYNTLGVSVLFYNRTKNEWHKNLPN